MATPITACSPVHRPTRSRDFSDGRVKVPTADESAVQRFYSEVRAAARLHAAIGQVEVAVVPSGDGMAAGLLVGGYASVQGGWWLNVLAAPDLMLSAHLMVALVAFDSSDTMVEDLMSGAIDAMVATQQGNPHPAGPRLARPSVPGPGTVMDDPARARPGRELR